MSYSHGQCARHVCPIVRIVLFSVNTGTDLWRLKRFHGNTCIFNMLLQQCLEPSTWEIKEQIEKWFMCLICSGSRAISMAYYGPGQWECLGLHGISNNWDCHFHCFNGGLCACAFYDQGNRQFCFISLCLYEQTGNTSVPFNLSFVITICLRTGLCHRLIEIADML